MAGVGLEGRLISSNKSPLATRKLEWGEGEWNADKDLPVLSWGEREMWVPVALLQLVFL